MPGVIHIADPFDVNVMNHVLRGNDNRGLRTNVFLGLPQTCHEGISNHKVLSSCNVCAPPQFTAVISRSVNTSDVNGMHHALCADDNGEVLALNFRASLKHGIGKL